MLEYVFSLSPRILLPVSPSFAHSSSASIIRRQFPAPAFNFRISAFDFSGNWNYFAAVRSEKRAPKLEATHLEKAKGLYTKHLANMYAANGAGVVLAEKGQFDIAKEPFTQVQETFRPSPKHAVKRGRCDCTEIEQRWSGSMSSEKLKGIPVWRAEQYTGDTKRFTRDEESSNVKQVMDLLERVGCKMWSR
ncbi:hypothetical protein L2E82_36698 [Cichorium intybus]|uniref:Uncharacterized protein n=1 Tax=Cichorium intybus TaxID=13427 RepID=A0ACB9ADA6_CICIN|nr:hypothetical protein L2E82_36698 [Cichorium intybus]